MKSTSISVLRTVAVSAAAGFVVAALSDLLGVGGDGEIAVVAAVIATAVLDRLVQSQADVPSRTK